MNPAIPDLEKLFVEVAQNPPLTRRLRPAINHSLGQDAKTDLSDLFSDHYLATHQDLTRSDIRSSDIMDIRHVAEVVPLMGAWSTELSPPNCLTPEHPQALPDHVTLCRHSAIDGYVSQVSGFELSFRHDLPICLRRTQDERNVIVPLSSPGHDGLYLQGGLAALKGERVHVERVAMIHDHFVGNNYCHWLLDWLPRIHLLEQTGADLRKHTFIFPRALAPFQRQSLDTLGIGPEQILEIPNDPDQTHRPIIAFRHFVATSTIRGSYAHALHGGSRWAADFLRTRLAQRIRPSTIRNIIVERRRTRRLILSPADRRRLSRNGFVSIDLETLTFAEQIALFRGARRVVAAHGAGLANLVFCRPGARVLEVFPPDYSTAAYWLAATASDVKYSCAVGTRVPRANARHIRDHDIFLSQDALVRWMTS